MNKLILHWPNSKLKVHCTRILPNLTEHIVAAKALIQDLKDTLAESGGVGLAANQIGASLSVLIIDSKAQGVKAFVNPFIIQSRDWEMKAEGCLSVPGIVAEVRRAKTIVVEYLDLGTGKTVQEEFEGLDAHILQHEIDHINGIVFIDYLSAGVRDQIRSNLRKKR